MVTLNAWQTALAVAGGVVGAVAVLWPVGIWLEVRKCERPKYAVVRKLASKPGDRRKFRMGPFQEAEVRRYAPMLIAEVEVDGTMKEATSGGFTKIARFIFGQNTRADGAGGGEVVAMTSPVQQELLPKGPSEPIAMTSPVVMSMGPSEPIAMTSPVVMSMAGTEALPRDAPGKARMSFVMPSKYNKETLPRPNDGSVEIVEVPAKTVASLSFRGQIRHRSVVEERKKQLLQIMQAEGLAPEGNVTLLQYHPPFTYGIQRVNEVQFVVKE